MHEGLLTLLVNMLQLQPGIAKPGGLGERAARHAPAFAANAA